MGQITSMHKKARGAGSVPSSIFFDTSSQQSITYTDCRGFSSVFYNKEMNLKGDIASIQWRRGRGSSWSLNGQKFRIDLGGSTPLGIHPVVSILSGSVTVATIIPETIH
jgi:hypothetical protein